MKVFTLLYNSFIWGVLASILAFQSIWLEMRLNTAVLIPIVMVLCLILGALLEKLGKRNLFQLRLKATIINLLTCAVISILVLGIKRMRIIPASIVREGIGVTNISFDAINAILFIILLVGLILCFIKKDGINNEKFL